MISWSISECYIRYVRKLLVSFFCIKDIYLSRSIYINNNDILCPLSFMIIIDVSVHLGLLSIIIISLVQYASIIIIIDVRLVIFHNGAWIVLGSNTINDNFLYWLCCCHTTLSHKRAMIVSSLLWLTFCNKRGGGVAIGFPLYWAPVWIVIPCNHPFHLHNHLLGLRNHFLLM